jgi:ATP-dependent Clp protease, protease subunit
MEENKSKSNSVIFVSGVISDTVVKDTIKSLGEAAAEGLSEVVVQISSGGGRCDESFGLYDYLRNASVSITTRVYGNCGSMAVILLLAGEKRYISKHSRIFLHEMTTTFAKETTYSLSEFRLSYESLCNHNDQYADIIRERLRKRMSKEEIYALMKAETYLSPQEALNRGFVDAII